MNIIILDTETTGMWKFKDRTNDPTQPHLIQLAAILERDGKEEVELNTYVQLPQNVLIEEGALNVHGITPAMAAEGMSLLTALTQLDTILSNTHLLVCHNISFDTKVLRASYNRAGIICTIPNINTFCTMIRSTDICRLPGRRGYKWPKLDEAYRILVDPSGFEGAHDALADVRACQAVYHAIIARDKDNQPTER